MAKASKRAVVGQMKAKGFEHIKILKPAVEPPKARAARIRRRARLLSRSPGCQVTNVDVFINCPFDADYRPAFEALIFTITASGYRVRCALEEDNSADIRHEKLCRLIRESDRSIHDLSRVELGRNKLPRFNMPYELGLTHGAIKFGGRRQRTKTACIMAEPYAMPSYISDLAGNDPFAHHNDPARVVRNYLHQTPDGQLLPGPASILAQLARFKRDLPSIAADFDIDSHEIDPYESYMSYLVFLTTFMTETT